eukprot:TRINITY_DN10404_c0_g1_i1.p2 TRINITY_DN10404_c0_g1~~TRINITY_DN10404_c0_g1_i1.p2  ORF type:complete len:210 (+),score=13.82 TRINITY_DN10404_c0_g1_i1:323-952(+)
MIDYETFTRNIMDPMMNLDSGIAPKPYTPESYEDIGRSILISLLDLVEQNPQSRIPRTFYGTMRNMKIAMGLELIKKAPYRFDNTLRPIMKTLEKSIDKFISFLDSPAKYPPPEQKEEPKGILPAIINRTKYGSEQRPRELSKAQSDKKENRGVLTKQVKVITLGLNVAEKLKMKTIPKLPTSIPVKSKTPLRMQSEDIRKRRQKRTTL